MLNGVLVIVSKDDSYPWQFEVVEIGDILAFWVMPEHDPMFNKAALQMWFDSGNVTHSPDSRPGIFLRASPNFG